MKIKIKDEEVQLKTKMRAYLIYEELSKKSFQPTSLMDILIYFYSVVLANVPDIELSFDEFLDYLDDNPTALADFNEWLAAEAKMAKQFDNKKSKKK